jgi:hypothetical protein
VITDWKAHRNGIRLAFNQRLDPRSIRPDKWFVQQWNYLDSEKTYGSPEYSVKQPTMLGHDRLRVTKVSVLADQKTIFLEIPDLLPAMCTQVRGTLTDAQNAPVDVDLYATLQHLRDDAPEGATTPADRPAVVAVPRSEQNGNTHQNILEHFDRLAGREPAKRAVTPDVVYRKEELNYRWISTHLLQTYCMPCHGPGTQHDYSTYAGLRAKLRLDAPRKSMLHGMLQTGGMPPYPLPRISPSLQNAVLEWINLGAPE